MMFDSKMLLVILAIALVIFGTKRLRSIGTDLGAAVKGFKQAMNDGESEEKAKQLRHDADFEQGVATPGGASAGIATPGVTTPGGPPGAAPTTSAAREAAAKAPPNANV